MEGIRAAASFEGLLILAAIYFVLNLLSQAGKKRGRSTAPPPPAPEEPTPTQEEALSLENILREIEKVKQEKAQERRLPPVERPAPPPPRPRPQQPARAPLPARRPAQPSRPAPMRGDPRRGPLGRSASRPLESAEDVEERESLEGASLEVEESLEVLDETRLRPPRPLEDFDDDAEAIVQRRVKAAEERNREHRAVDHVAFHGQIEQGEIGEVSSAAAKGEAAARKGRTAKLRQAIIWREILGPPKSTEL